MNLCYTKLSIFIELVVAVFCLFFSATKNSLKITDGVLWAMLNLVESDLLLSDADVYSNCVIKLVRL